jgi:hypothetical protein
MRSSILLVAVLSVLSISVVLAAKQPPPPVVGPADNLMLRINVFMTDSMDLRVSSPFARINAITMVAIHDAINTLQEIYDPVFQQDRLRGDDKKANYRAAMLGALNETRYYQMNNIPNPYNANILLPGGPTGFVGPLFGQLNSFINTEMARLATEGADADKVKRGFAIGTRVGRRVNQLRENDGYKTFRAPFDPECGIPGKWCSWFERQNPNKTAGARGVTYTNYAYIKPFSYGSPTDIMCPPPVPFTNNQIWESGYNTTMMFGGQDTVFTSPALKEEVKIWAIGPSVSLMSRFMTEFYNVAQLTHTEYDSVAMFAAHYVVNFDAGIHLNYNKYFYGAWRPFQMKAIRENAPYTAFKSIVDLHANPEYPCGQCEGTTTSAKTFERFLGYDAFPFPQGVKMIVPGATVQPEYHSWSEVSEGVARGRIFGGVHLPMSTQIGVLYGTKIANQHKLFQKVCDD